jgi:SNF2 family DNA or RNA helicase
VIPLYPRQAECVDAIVAMGGTALLAGDLGSGKTRMALATGDRLGARKTLVLCPLSVVRVWEQEIHTLLPGTAVMRLPGQSVAKQAQALGSFGEGIVLANYDACWRVPLKRTILRWQPDLVVCDEAQRLSHRTSKRSKFAHELVLCVPWRLGLSGTPTGARLKKLFDKKSRLVNLFSIMKFVDADVLGKRYEDFEGRYCTMAPVRGTMVKYVAGYKELEELESLVMQRTVVLHREEIIELPPCVDVPVLVDLDEKTMETYRTLEEESIVRLSGLNEQGEATNGVLVARITLATVTKLQQIACGSVIINEPDGGRRVIDISDEKLRATEELVADALPGTNVVVGARFRRDVRRLAERLTPVADHVVVIQGGQTPKERDAALDTFVKRDRVVAVCQMRAASLGINDLVGANLMIIFSCEYDPEPFIQFHDRLHRPGQTRKVTVLHLLGDGTVDLEIYDALRNGIDVTTKARDLAYASKLLRAGIAS